MPPPAGDAPGQQIKINFYFLVLVSTDYHSSTTSRQLTNITCNDDAQFGGSRDHYNGPVDCSKNKRIYVNNIQFSE